MSTQNVWTSQYKQFSVQDCDPPHSARRKTRTRVPLTHHGWRDKGGGEPWQEATWPAWLYLLCAVSTQEDETCVGASAAWLDGMPGDVGRKATVGDAKLRRRSASAGSCEGGRTEKLGSTARAKRERECIKRTKTRRSIRGEGTQAKQKANKICTREIVLPRQPQLPSPRTAR